MSRIETLRHRMLHKAATAGLISGLSATYAVLFGIGKIAQVAAPRTRHTV